MVKQQADDVDVYEVFEERLIASSFSLEELRETKKKGCNSLGIINGSAA